TDAEHALALARRAKDPQILFLTLAGAAHIHSQAGDERLAVYLAGEVLEAVASGQPLAFAVTWIHVLAWTLAEGSRGTELVNALSPLRQQAWVRAAIAFAQSDPLSAAEICADVGAVTQEAYARLTAARDLTGRGRRA